MIRELTSKQSVNRDSLRSTAVLGGAQSNKEKPRGDWDGSFAASSRALYARFVALPLSRAPDKTAMLHRLESGKLMKTVVIRELCIRCDA